MLSLVLFVWPLTLLLNVALAPIEFNLLPALFTLNISRASKLDAAYPAMLHTITLMTFAFMPLGFRASGMVVLDSFHDRPASLSNVDGSTLGLALAKLWINSDHGDIKVR